jgi:biopolymer transport protein ExbD
MLHRRYNKVGEFPVLIRADKKTKHQDVRAVMDLCTSVGLWKINFAAVKQEAGKAR